jgi:hypothetical protein
MVNQLQQIIEQKKDLLSKGEYKIKTNLEQEVADVENLDIL